jgi:integrase
MISYVPYYRADRGAVVIRIIVNGLIAKVVPTGIKIEEHQWNDRKVIKHPNKVLFNQKIQNKISELQREITKAEILGVSLTKDRVKRLAEGGKVTTDFFEHCKTWLKEKHSNKGTLAAAMSDLRKVHAYSPSLQFGDIDARWLYKYEKYVREVLGNQGNTPWKAMKFIRTMLYDAQTIIGRHIHNPFEEKTYKMPPYTDPKKDGLYLEELARIEKILVEPHPTVIKLFAAKFLFMCYTGLRISDAKRFTEEFIKNGDRIVVTSVKTGITTNTKIYSRLNNVLLNLKQLPSKNISDQKFNEYLKTIAEIAGIDRLPFSSHLGRHTFGCLLAEAGVTEEEAMELMGVKSKKVVKVYYQLRQPQIDRATSKLDLLLT